MLVNSKSERINKEINEIMRSARIYRFGKKSGGLQLNQTTMKFNEDLNKRTMTIFCSKFFLIFFPLKYNLY